MAAFASTDEINRPAPQACDRYLETGKLTEGHRNTEGANTARELVELLKAK